MREQERLFFAMSGVDEDLLERSERTARRSRRPRWMAWTAAAACLAVTAAVWAFLPEQLPAADPAAADPPALQDSPETPSLLEGAGQLHLLRCGMETESPKFSIYFDGSAYHIYEPEGAYIIRPNDQPPGLPDCQLEILHMPGATLDEAVEARRRQAEILYRSVTLMDEAAADLAWGWPETTARRLLLASDGTDWDDRQADSWFVEDGQGGVFVLTSSYFLEAAEGFGARFYDMVCTFRVEDGDAPVWQAELEDTAERLIDAVSRAGLSHLDDVVDGEPVDLDPLPSGEAAEISVGGIDYTVSEQTGGLAATVRVKYRYGPEEPYAYLTMQLVYEDSRWHTDEIVQPAQ